MYISKVYLGNFGKFHQKTVHFMPGLNVVYGENESGKSTLHSFLTAMLFGMEKPRGRGMGAYQKYEPWNISNYYTGSMEIVVADKRFTLERNFYHKEKTVRLYNQEDGEELSVEHGDLEMLLGGVSRRFYENTCCISQASIVTERDFATELQQQLMNQLCGGEQQLDIVQAQRKLEAKKKAAEQCCKQAQQKRQQQKERLEWEQEILHEDMRQLQEKLLWVEEQRKNTLEDVAQISYGAKEYFSEGAREKKERIIWRIPIIGWVLKKIQKLWRRLIGNKKEDNQENRRKINEKATQESIENKKGLEAACEMLQEQIKEKQIRLYNVQEELEDMRKVSGEEQEILLEIESIGLAIETIQKVAKESYRDSRDSVQDAISQIFSGITNGRYVGVELTEQGQMYLWREQEQGFWQSVRETEISERTSFDRGKLESWQLSRGTLEQLYFALRLGTGRKLMQEEMLPVLLDEPFCAYDDIRLKRTLHWMSQQKEQMILFTCQKRELQMLEELGAVYNPILL